MIWELESAQEALRNGEYQLASRYIEKALEQVRCMYCHQELNDTKPYQPHFKGYVHDECSQLYSGRIDYENKNGSRS